MIDAVILIICIWIALMACALSLMGLIHNKRFLRHYIRFLMEIEKDLKDDSQQKGRSSN